MRSLATFVLFALLGALPAQAQTPAATPRAPGIDRSDDRVVVDVAQMPWRAIGKVQTNLAASCTGTLVGARLVLTAGHCIYQKALRNLLPASSLHFLAGFKSGDFAAHAQVVKLEYPPGLLALLRGQTREVQNDWLILVLDQPLGDRFGTLALARTPLLPGTAIRSAGYAQDHRLLMTADLDCKVTTLSPPLAPIFEHDCETTNGNSGGPLIVQQDGEWRIAGIVRGLLTFPDKRTAGYAIDVSVLRDRLEKLK